MSDEHSATIIVAIIIQNEKKEFLLVQEAKPSCRGLWYLPAGRALNGETLFSAAVRECEEESGLIIKPTGIFNVTYKPFKDGTWIRLGITGNVTGGELKSKPDEESLCAKWFSEDQIASMAKGGELRSLDLLSLLKMYKSTTPLPIEE